MSHILEVAINAEGHELAYLSPEGGNGGYRIAGPKALGGSKQLAKLKVRDEDIITYIKKYAPNIVAALRSE